ncbi:MAG: DUF5343 domain-containing protein [Anaerolinea sp.]|nr:DUF5343 domain-containing protein [Anaerolinea sp.]
MADEKKTYPYISPKNWFSIRKWFLTTMPKEVTPALIATRLNMSEGSARANVHAALIRTGIVDKDNRPTDRARRWREDNEYKAVCDEIRNEVYSQSLIDLASDTSIDRETIERWFRNLGLGDDAASKQAAFYLLLTEGDPKKESAA